MSRIVVDARSRGSTGRYAERLLHHLQSIDHENRYFVLVKSDQDWQPMAENFTRVVADVEDYSWQEQIRLLGTIRSLHPDLVHFTMPQQPVLHRGKTVTTIHDLTMLRFHNVTGNRLVYWGKLMVFRCLLYVVSRKSQALIAPTDWVKRDIERTLRVRPDKIHVTYESADPIPAEAGAIQALQDKSFILFNGNVFPHKNVRRLIEAYEQVKVTHPDLLLVIAGKLGEQGIRLQAEVEHITGVLFLGFVPDDELKWLMENARAYVYPSLSEGFGLPGLEAMLLDTPVVSSNATCLPEVYKDAAHYFDPLDVRDMANKISEVLADDSLRDRLIHNGQELLRTYDWGTLAKQTLSVYRSVIESR
ncbi:MAG: glycosyltransferase family 4 protein [Coriobacteriia bacterium]|nr:glycosyltransferase family 4 protein [Coriobacteriia bacterium]